MSKLPKLQKKKGDKSWGKLNVIIHKLGVVKKGTWFKINCSEMYLNQAIGRAKVINSKCKLWTVIFSDPFQLRS